MSQLIQKPIKKFHTITDFLMHKNGAVYTPQTLADYLAQKTVQYILDDPDFKVSKISIVDPACGEGILLDSVTRLLMSKKRKRRVTVCGIDVDQNAIMLCKKRLGQTFREKISLSTIHTNALCPYGVSTLDKGLKQIFDEASIDNGFDVLIANPPWGADISRYKTKLDTQQYFTLKGQVDSFELFVELATKLVKKGGYFAFIVPDSILNHGKSILRDKLIESTEIKFVARLGEKIFPEIFRACVLIVCKNSIPSVNNLVDCFRLSSSKRNMILDGQLTFIDVEKTLAHKVPQNRFANNPYKQFDIDLRQNETTLLDKLRRKTVLGNVLTSTRGIELGSSGTICSCNQCGIWTPLSEKKSIKCKNCGKNYDPQKSKIIKISTKKRLVNSVPLITGKDLKRYTCIPTSRIILGKNGINYKPRSIYESPKILIRKTGVGLTAALDYTSSHTTQVVYILRNKEKTNRNLEFFIALINSRLYYFFLVKSFGELEWRSHPYLTQSQILSLPLPDLQSEKNKKIMNRVVSLLKPILKKGKPPKHIDLEIELLIGSLFGLTKNDYKIMFDTINESDDLLPVRDLKNFGLEEILDKLDR